MADAQMRLPSFEAQILDQLRDHALNLLAQFAR